MQEVIRREQAWLVNDQGEHIPLQGHCTFGRTSGNTVVLPMPKMSRRHAMIQEQAGEYWIVDLGSTNGVQVNGERIFHPLRLSIGDRLEFPGGTFLFQCVAEPEIYTRHEITKVEIRTSACWILIADLKGFTRLSQSMPAAELAPLVGKWMSQCQEILTRHKGVLAKFLGDGFFGYWTARDGTDALVAAAINDFDHLRAEAPLAFRMILHRGELSFGGNTLEANNTIIGSDLNFTFRLEKVASRLGLLWLFSETAARDLAGRLSLISCGAQHVPDFAPERQCFTLPRLPAVAQ